MTDIENYKKQVLTRILEDLEPDNDILAAWEGGSAANGSVDQFSDIDLCILASTPLQQVLDRVEKALEKFSVVHTWQTRKSFFGDGMMQRVIVLKDAPKYFSVDAAVFDFAHPQILKDFMEVERHGQPTVFFDKRSLIKVGHTDPQLLFERHQSRVDELNAGFPIYMSLVLKEIERGHSIDAIGFYQNGLVRPLIEVLGMIYRPFKSDFGMRYIHKTFPLDKQKIIEDLNYVSGLGDLTAKVVKAEKIFEEAVRQVKSKSKL